MTLFGGFDPAAGAKIFGFGTISALKTIKTAKLSPPAAGQISTQITSFLPPPRDPDLSGRSRENKGGVYWRGGGFIESLSPDCFFFK